MTPGATEFWRVSNSGADTILNLQVHGTPQHCEAFPFLLSPVQNISIPEKDCRRVF